MNKLLALGLCLACCQANAQQFTPVDAGTDWNMIAVVPSRGLSFWQHKDVASSGKVGEIRHTTEVVNFNIPQRESYSYSNATVYDCVRGLYKITEQVWYSEWFASGKVVKRLDNSEADFRQIPANSPTEKSASYVCLIKGV